MKGFIIERDADLRGWWIDGESAPEPFRKYCRENMGTVGYTLIPYKTFSQLANEVKNA